MRARHAGCGILVALAVLQGEAGIAAEASAKLTDPIPAQPVAAALSAFSRQTGIQIIYWSTIADGMLSSAAPRGSSAQEALQALLSGTGLRFEFLNERTVTITSAVGQSPARPALRTTSAASTNEAVAGPAPVTETGQRETPREEKPGFIDEIVVTARRREEKLQDVPVAISALSGEELRNKRIETSTDLQNFVPSLNVSSGVNRDDTTIVIRGMGPTGGSGPGAVLGGGGSGVVAYFAEAVATGAGPGLFYDLENVQVIKGPQGTLFGKNTTGGVVLFTPRKPGDQFEGYADVGLGNYGMRSVDTAINVPLLNEALLVRFAAHGQQRDGFTTDHGLFAGRDYDNRDYWAARVSIVFRPTEAFENYTIFSSLNSDGHGDGYVLSAVNPDHPFGPALAPILAEQQRRGIRSTAYSVDQIDKRRTHGVINTTTWSLSDDVTFKNIFSYQVQKWQNANDIDATTLVLSDLVGRQSAWHTQTGTYTEEAQLQGTALAGDLKWTVGGYFERARDIDVQPFLVRAAFGNFEIVQPDQTNSSRSRGLYAQTTYDLGGLHDPLRGLKLTTGYRYTWDDYGFGVALYSPSQANACFTQPATYPESDCFLGASGDSGGQSWTLGLDYDLNGDTLLYVRSGRGYVPGGFNPAIAWLPGGDSLPQFRFEPQSVTDIELGVKSEITFGSMSAFIAADVFRSDFTNIQRLVSLTLPGGVQSNFTANASEARIEGFEFQGAVVPVASLTLDATYSYNSGKYTRIDPAAAPSLVGIPFAYLPKHKYSLSGAWTLPLPESIGEVKLQAAYSYQSSFFNAPAAQPLDHNASYDLLNLSLQWNNLLGLPMDASVYVTNATDEEYRVGQYSNYFEAGEIVSLYGEPRMYGMHLRYRFGRL